jgi:hypothetical protein
MIKSIFQNYSISQEKLQHRPQNPRKVDFLYPLQKRLHADSRFLKTGRKVFVGHHTKIYNR